MFICIYRYMSKRPSVLGPSSPHSRPLGRRARPTPQAPWQAASSWAPGWAGLHLPSALDGRHPRPRSFGGPPLNPLVPCTVKDTGSPFQIPGTGRVLPHIE